MKAEFIITLDTGERLTSKEAEQLAEFSRRQRIPVGELASSILREWLNKQPKKKS